MSLRRHPRSEHTTQEAILLTLGLYPRDVQAWRQNAGRAVIPGRGAIRLAPAGAPDITGYVRGGRRLDIEVKAPGGRLSPVQRAYRDRAIEMGVLYVVAYSVEDVLGTLRAEGLCDARWRRGA